jgi:hypothetical protein
MGESPNAGLIASMDPLADPLRKQPKGGEGLAGEITAGVLVAQLTWIKHPSGEGKNL